MRITKDVLRDLSRSSQLEWLEADGAGGWASSTVCGMNTRRYHGLLVVAARPPSGRTVLVARLDETLAVPSGRWELSVNQYPGAVHPAGHQWLTGFERRLFPVWTYRAGRIEIRKTIACIHGRNLTLVGYEVLDAPEDFALELRPFVAFRDYHQLTRASDRMSPAAVWRDDVLRIPAPKGMPDAYVRLPGADFRPEADWFYSFEYPEEQRRGLDCHEDLFTPGRLAKQLRRGDTVHVALSAEPLNECDPEAYLREETRRRENLVSAARSSDHRTLLLAADQFVVSGQKNRRSVVAGYHWFGDWGRDTMIALPGLTLTTGRHADARSILETYASYMHEGMLPNRFPDEGEFPEYNTVDAALWFFVAVYRYGHYSGDWPWIHQRLFPVLVDIIRWHRQGMRYGIRVDEDGLLRAGEEGVQLTWMDARVGDWVVTPRSGKPVEVNALWYNALCILAHLLDLAGKVNEARTVRENAETVRVQFNEKFWNSVSGCLYDVIDEPRYDGSIRPNQLLAISLPFPLVDADRAECILEVIDRHLLTPFGLRSLSPLHRDYRARYLGDVPSRDGAYHQGTVWSWLLGPYIDAIVRIRGRRGIEASRSLMHQALKHLHAGCMGTVSEIFDGSPPFTPRGAVAQAWSVAEWLRVLVEYDLV